MHINELICVKCPIILVIINNNMNSIDVKLNNKKAHAFLETYFMPYIEKEDLFSKSYVDIWRKFLKKHLKYFYTYIVSKKINLYYGLFQDIEYIFLCYTVELCHYPFFFFLTLNTFLLSLLVYNLR